MLPVVAVTFLRSPFHYKDLGHEARLWWGTGMKVPPAQRMGLLSRLGED